MADPERIAARLQALWDVARGPGGGADRPAFSEAEAVAMRLVAGWAGEHGLTAGIDAHGNLWALPAEWDGPLVTAGSHVDTVPDGGRYDGALGTVLGLELIDDLAGPPGARAVPGAAAVPGGPAGPGATRPALLVCAAEEAPRFGAGTIGSRLLVGTLPEGALGDLVDAAGTTAAQARAAYLQALADLPAVADPPLDRLRAHCEIHVATRRGVTELGVVRRIASPRRFTVTVTGRAGHAGEISMEDRRDALAAAAEIILALEAAAQAEPWETVATVGDVAVAPGAVSVIPAQARLSVDVRGISSESVGRVEDALRAAAAGIAQRRDVDAEIRLVRGGDPVEMDAGLAREALTAAASLGIPAAETWSGSGHDAQHLAALAPSLLMFVPLHGGESHTPQEGADMGEILAAASVAAAVLRR